MNLSFPWSSSDSIFDRLGILLPQKLLLALGLNLCALLPYYLLQHYPSFPVTVMGTTVVDRWIFFDDRTVWVYLSLFLLMPVAPMQMTAVCQLRRYAFGVIGMSLSADLIYLFWPTAVARPPIEAANAVYLGLTTLVAPSNAFPSLHAAMAVYSALCCEQIHVKISPWFWRTIIWFWALAIIYSTLSTKMHVSFDAVSGSALGLLAYLTAFGIGERASVERTLRSSSASSINKKKYHLSANVDNFPAKRR